MPHDELDELVTKLTEDCESLVNELATVKTNKSSALRARKLTQTITNLGKAFRKESVAFHKK